MSSPTPDSAHTPRVLVVEDVDKTRQSLVEGLALEGWDTKGISNCEAAQQALENESWDLVVLDWMLPDGSGLDLLRRIRARGVPTPVLILTARETVDDRVSGLEAGADDYLAKPFAFSELVARSRALLRRPLLSAGQLLRCADLQLDTRARVAKRDGQEIPLTPREVDILEYLLRYQGQIVTRDMLEHDVWKEPRRYSSLDNVIDVQMMRLRRKVDPEGSTRLIQTLRGQGYRMGSPE